MDSRARSQDPPYPATRVQRYRRTVGQHRAVNRSVMGAIYVISKTQERRPSPQSSNTVSSGSPSESTYELEYATDIILLPSSWLITLGLKIGCIMRLVRSAFSGWQVSLKALHVVPDNALIFEFCQRGDVQAVRSLCERGLVSVNDIDSMGRTPLYVRRDSLPNA